MRSPRGAALAFVWLVVLLDLIGNGLILPVTPLLIMRTTGLGGADGAMLGGALLMAYAAMQLLFAPFVGRLSDRYGRRPILLLAMAGLSINYALMAFAPNFEWLFVGRLVSGVFGSTFATALAVVADVAPEEERAKSFGLIHAATGIGLVAGPILGGVLGQVDPSWPFLAAAVIAVFNLLLGLVFFKETRPSSNAIEYPAKDNQRAALPADSALWFLLGAYFLMQVAIQSLPSVWSFFLQSAFNWSPLMIGGSMAFYGLMMALVQTTLPGPLSNRIGAKGTAAVAGLFAISAYLAFAFAPTDDWIFPVIVFGSVGVIAFPSLQAALSARVDGLRQGETQGLIARANGLAMIVGPIALTQVFAWGATGASGQIWLGAPFGVAALLTAVGVVLIGVSRDIRPKHTLVGNAEVRG